MKTNSIILIFFAAFMVLGIWSCEKDIEGCTNPDAENFNPDATIEIGQCIFARDKFIGSYLGSLNCEAPLPNSEEFLITITEDPEKDSGVLIDFESSGLEIPPLTGNVSGNQITIDSMEANIALDPNMPNLTTPFIYFGNATMSEDQQTVSGILSVFVAIFNTTLSCNLEGIKQ